MKVGDKVRVKDDTPNTEHNGCVGVISVVRSGGGAVWLDFPDGESVPYDEDELEVVEEA